MNSSVFSESAIETPGFRTNVVTSGSGTNAVLFVHGSGPGATGMANWRGTLPALPTHRCVAFDLAGFGESIPRAQVPFTVPTWTKQAFEVMDRLGIDTISVVGNSLGGRIAMQMALDAPERIERLVLMGSGGLLVEPTPALRALREYTPSLENMQHLIEHCFLFDPSLSSPALVRERYETSAATFETYRGMFGEDRSGLLLAPERIASIQAPSLVVHGRDDKVIPPANGVRMAELLPDADLHLFARCGHWAQFERAADFNALIASFL
jgi:pimeloyl-ACP methyl ester carboxylesterase